MFSIKKNVKRRRDNIIYIYIYINTFLFNLNPKIHL